MKKGFTLIEVVASMCIVGIIAVAVFPLISVCLNRNMQANIKDEEFRIARSICEGIKSKELKLDTDNIIFFINNISEISDYTKCNQDFFNIIHQDNNMKYKVIIKSTKQQELNVFNVTVSHSKLNNIYVSLWMGK